MHDINPWTKPFQITRWDWQRALSKKEHGHLFLCVIACVYNYAFNVTELAGANVYISQN